MKREREFQKEVACARRIRRRRGTKPLGLKERLAGGLKPS